MPFDFFHSITSRWFAERFGTATEPQRLGWPSIAGDENTLIAAPTGSGKTLTAFLVCIDRLLRRALAGKLEDECKILYLSPLKALASDIRKNLEIPLEEIQEFAKKEGFEIERIRSQVRTGDTPAHERQAISRKPPHILVTTPESFYLMLTTEKGRKVLETVETVIVDEIHALARDKRGSHLSLSLERLKALTHRMPTMIGLSATQKPVEEIASFLVGVGNRCNIFDVGHTRELDLGLITPPSPLSTVCSHEQWEEIYQQVAEQIRNHRSTVVFVNTRRLAERVAFRLSEILGDDQVLCHHGSLSKNRRLNAESLLKEGRLKAIVATASLELGIDIGYIDLVCQIGIPYSIATFLQRIGRSGHAIKAIPKGRIVALNRDELVEALALVRAVKQRRLDKIEVPIAPLDILTQQLIAECAGRGAESSMAVDEAFAMTTRAWPYRSLSREDFLKVIHMASDGFAPGRRRFAYLLWDRLKNELSVKSGARLAAVTSGGSIPEMGEFRVVLEDDGTVVGTVNEDFAIESLAGDVFLLGTHSWKIKHVRGGEVVVRDAQGQPPSIPFWLGESPGRTPEFSFEVSELRREMADRISEIVGDSPESQTEAVKWLETETGLTDRWPLAQAAEYLGLQKAAFGMVPTLKQIVFERFFDEAGGMQLVIHSPYGARINRGWGLALRKRFCRTFDFELQASADDDGIVLSLGPQQSFPIEQLFKMLTEANVEHFLVQALLAAPMFGARWRWNATRSLAILRQMGGKRVAPALQRFRSEDLLTAVFPAQTACQENAPGDIEVPDHPLVKQTVHDCLHEAMDIDGLKALFHEIEEGRVELIAKDTREPSPFAYPLLNASPYAFLDDAPLEDRRTRSVSMRAALSPQDLQDLVRMDPKAIEQVREQAWPDPKTTSEFYETLVATPAFPEGFLKSFGDLPAKLLSEGRATWATIGTKRFLVAAESIPVLNAAYDKVVWENNITLPDTVPVPSTSDARQMILKGWLEIRGPIPNEEFTDLFSLDNTPTYLEAIESTGTILRCRLNTEEKEYSHWCMRGLLRRIHRLTVEGLREQIRPASPQDFFELLFEEHGLVSKAPHAQRGADDLLAVVGKLQGFEAPAVAWEKEIFACRIAGYRPSFLDTLTSQGKVAFGRLRGHGQRLSSSLPLSFVLRRDWNWIAQSDRNEGGTLSSQATDVLESLKQSGAQFVDELRENTGLLETQVEAALRELAAEGLVTCDQFHAFRKKSLGGRWSLLRRPTSNAATSAEDRESRLERWAWQLLFRYGIVFRDILEREMLSPSWGELVRFYRRLEARGEVRGGRFITGVSGEQYGLSDTHEKLIRIREERAQGKRKGTFAVIASSDPLNLIGIVTKGDKVASNRNSRLLFEDGEWVAICNGTRVETFRPVGEEQIRALRLAGSYRSRLLLLGPDRHVSAVRNAPVNSRLTN